MFFTPNILRKLKFNAMLYFERSYKVLNQINRLSTKIVYDTIKPFIEMPPLDRQINVEKEAEQNCAADLFTRFTADIMNANVLFIR